MRILESRLAQRARRSRVVRPPAIAVYRTLDRIMPAPPGPRVVANSMPKAGTHLLTSLLESLPKMRFAGQLVSYLGADGVGAEDEFAHFEKRVGLLRDSHYIGGHLAYDNRADEVAGRSGVRIVTMIRDPRAQVVSWAHYLLSATHVPGRSWVIDRYPDMDSLLPILIRGFGEPYVFPYLPDIGARFRRYSGWSASDKGIVVRFEDLVGPSGGGSETVQLETTRRIIDYLGYPDAEAQTARVVDLIFSPNSATFRSGQAEGWRAELPEPLAQEVVDRCGESMQRWGYDT